MAADSFYGNAFRESQSGCKIFKRGDVYWAAATHYFEYEHTGFSLAKILASVAPQGNLAAEIDVFVKAVTAPLERAIADSRKYDPSFYAQLAAGKGSPLEIVFIAVKNGEPKYESITFIPEKLKGRISLKPRRLERTAPTPQRPIVVNGLGSYEAAFVYLQQHGIGIDPARTITESLAREATADPTRVGPPFSIIRLDSKGAQWLTQGECKQ